VINLSEANIEIGISLVLKEATAIPAVKKLVDNLKELKEVYSGLPESLKGLSKGVSEGNEEAMNKMKQLMDYTNKVVGEQAQEQERLGRAVGESSSKVREYVSEVLKAVEAGQTLEEAEKSVAGSMEISSRQVDRGIATLNTYKLVAGELGIELNKVKPLLDSITTAEKEHTAILAVNEKLLSGLRHAERLEGEQLESLANKFSMTGNQAKEYSKMLKKVAEQTQLNTYYNKLLRGAMTPVQRISRQIAREFFWTGLGIMFTTMSIARSLNRYRQLYRESNQLAVSMINVNRATKDYNEILIRYGRYSDEAKEAGYRLRLSQMRQKEQLEDLRSSTQQFYLSMMMLIWGAFPSALRTGAMLVENLLRYQVAQTASTASTMTSAMATMYDTTVTTASIGAKTASGVASLKLSSILSIQALKTMIAANAQQMLVGALTFGVGALASFAISMALTEITMRDFERRSKSLKEELYGSGLHEALMETSKATELLGQELDKLQIPEVKDIVIREELIKEDIPEREDQIVNIIQRLEETDIPIPKDITQTIYQTVEEIDIGELESIEQIVRQRLLEADIPKLEDLEQKIEQVIEVTGARDIERVTEDISFEGVDRALQLINKGILKLIDSVQLFHESYLAIEGINPLNRIAIIISGLQNKFDYLRRSTEEYRGEIERIPDRDISVTQELIKADIPEVENQTYRLSAIINIPTIPDIPSKTFQIKGEISRETNRNIDNIREELSSITRETVIGMGLGDRNIRVRHEYPELERNINMNPVGDINNNYVFNVSFPNLIIREEADIPKIRKELERVFMSGYLSRGGR